MHTERTQADTSMKIPLPVNRSTAVDLVKAWLSEQVLTPRDIVSCSASICDGETKGPKPVSTRLQRLYHLAKERVIKTFLDHSLQKLSSRQSMTDISG